jgi:hypothetical protein
MFPPRKQGRDWQEQGFQSFAIWGSKFFVKAYWTPPSSMLSNQHKLQRDAVSMKARADACRP